MRGVIEKCLTSIKFINMEKVELLAFKQSYEKCSQEIEAVKGRLKRLEKSLKKVQESMVRRKARVQELEEAKSNFVEEYKASLEHTKNLLQVYSEGFTCGLRNASRYQPEFSIELIPNASCFLCHWG